MSEDFCLQSKTRKPLGHRGTRHDKKEVSRLYKKAKVTRDPSDWETYKLADKKFKRLCNRDKNRAWRKYKESIQCTKDTLTGQNNLNYVQSKIHPGIISELCRFCEEEDETFAHLLNECPCFLAARRDILRNVPVINTVKWKPQALLAFSNIESIDDA